MALQMTGLYLHIPFCRTRCHYCDFVITTGRSSSGKRVFLDALASEAAYYAPAFAKKKFDTLYFGGGTPSQLDPAEWVRLFEILRKYYSFTRTAEITVEANPGDVSTEKARALKALGVNRVSLGAQSFNEATLEKINRSHGARAIGEAFGNFRKAGITNISADLMLALPGETAADVKRSVKELLKLGPKHISLYELVVHEKTVFGALQKKKRLALPDEDASLEMLLFARGAFKKAGYRHYELLSYAKPGYESRHNHIYWANAEYLGLGPGAFSYIDGRRFQLAGSVEEYLKKMKAGDFSAREEETLSKEAREAESFVLALRLLKGVPKQKFRRVISRKKDTIRELIAKGLLNEKFALTERGQLFAETVFSELA